MPVPLHRLFRAASIVLAISSASRNGVAQSAAAAETLFRDARADMKASRFAEACVKFAESHRLDPSIGSLLNLAACEEKLGKIASAWARYSEVVDLAAPGDGRMRTATERRDALSPRLPKFRASGVVPKGATLELDGTTVAVLDSWLPVDPGRHTLTVKRGAEVKSLTFEAIESQTAQVQVPALDGPKPLAPGASSVPAVVAGPVATTAAPPPAPWAPPPSTRSRAPAYVFAGVGGVALLVSAVAGVSAVRKKSTVNDHCASSCDAEGAAAGRDGQRWVTAANISFAVGAVGLGAAGFWLATTPSSSGSRSLDVAYTGSFR